jgi:hypothetical protein
MAHRCFENLPQRDQFVVQCRSRWRAIRLTTMDAIFLHRARRDRRYAHVPEVGIEMEPDSILVAPNIGRTALAFGDDLILTFKGSRGFLERLFGLHLAAPKLSVKFKIPVLRKILGVT